MVTSRSNTVGRDVHSGVHNVDGRVLPYVIDLHLYGVSTDGLFGLKDRGMRTIGKAVLAAAAITMLAGPAANAAEETAHLGVFIDQEADGSVVRTETSAYAPGDAWDSPGVVAGNNIKAPIHIPVNACGLTVNVVGILNPAYGNTCMND